ncbi:hypothetical protein MBRA_53480 (plasmid) [Mycobacterium branderi]|uniref:Uncharacterized protein n=1 Tax=Mycobacterium branderi TaxID=43348 RepID=A0ABM7KVK3_9MYCO|nr:hypothetical protein MBRA_53480 [Mycobacterium branderi]
MLASAFPVILVNARLSIAHLRTRRLQRRGPRQRTKPPGAAQRSGLSWGQMAATANAPGPSFAHPRRRTRRLCDDVANRLPS